MRLKDIAYINPAYTGPDLGDQLVSFSPMECLRYDSLKPITISFSEAKGKYTFFKDNDILFAKVTPCFENQNIAIANNLVNGIGFGSSEINVLRLKSDASLRYMFYVICSNRFYNTGCSSMCGVGGLKRINPRAVSTFEFTMPSLAEQEAIAAYLDKECEKIGRKIELLERKADAYSRLRRSLINRAVTRGLDPNASLKPSPIAFVTEIPSHWEIRRIKSLFEERIEYSYTGNEDLLSVSEYYGIAKRADIIDNENISRSDSLEGYKRCYIGDIVSNIMLAWKGSLGMTNYNGIVSPAYGVYKPICKLNSRYYHYLFRTELYKAIFKNHSRGIIDSRLRLYTPNFLALKTFYPPLSEQNEIAVYLDEKCAKIDTILEKINTEVERLKELKRSLINKVVTGQRAIDTESRS